MKIRIEHILLVLVFAVVLALRLYFSLSVPNFNSDSAYYHLNLIENFWSGRGGVAYDELNYGGKPIVGSQFFELLLSLISFGSVILLKILLEIFLSSVVLFVYLMANEISKSRLAAVFSAALSGFVPVFLSETMNDLSVYSIFIPVLFLAFYCLFRLERKFYLWLFIICSFLLPLISAEALIFVLTSVVFLFLLSGGALSASKLKKEAIFFSIILILLAEFIVYKKAFLDYGIKLVWSNTPVNVFFDSFREMSTLDLLVGIGILPIFFGLVGLLLGIYKEKNKPVYWMSAFMLSILVLLFFRLISITHGLLFLGLTLCVLGSLSFAWLFSYIEKTKLGSLKFLVGGGLVIAVVFLSVYPAFRVAESIEMIDADVINDMNWLRENTPAESVVAGNINEGNLISTLGKRKNVVSSDFLLAPNPSERLEDINTIYGVNIGSRALNLLHKYKVNYVYLSGKTKSMHKINDLGYADDKKCFRREGNFYEVSC